MKLYLDSANIDEIREINKWGILSGVTTNPSLAAKEGRDFNEVLDEIVELVPGPISAEVMSPDVEGMLREAGERKKSSENVVIKIPISENGLEATRRLAKVDIDVNMTLIFSASQALLAARAGAAYVSPFVGRLDDVGEDGIELVRAISDIFLSHDIDTEIIAASIRNPLHVIRAAQAGADIATIPYKVFKQMTKHPLTDKGIAAFNADWENLKKEIAK